MGKLLLLARHATVEEAYKGCYIGSLDIPLGSEKEIEIASLARVIRQYKPTAVISSPLERARQTAAGVAAHLGYPVQAIQTISALREIDFGRWEGLRFEDIVSADPELVGNWAGCFMDFHFPDGESIREFLLRIHAVIEQLIRMSGRTVLVVTHGGVIRTMLCKLLDLAPKNYILFDIKPASLTMLKIHDNRGLLVGLNLGIREVT